MAATSHNCRSCGRFCRVVRIHHRGGRSEIEGYYCTQPGCELRNRNQLHYGEPGFHETTFETDWSARCTTFGRPSRGEANTLPTCVIFVGVLRQQFRLALGDPEPVAQSDDAQVDARSAWARSGHLCMQVTRALPSEDYEMQARDGQIERTRDQRTSVELLRRAIARKRERARRDITLLIDGRNAADLAFPAPTVFAHDHGPWARAQGWESIWVIGPSFAKRLDWSASETLPPSWPSAA